ncbi:hypothetical protein D3C76_502480 [compost metagenome]
MIRPLRRDLIEPYLIHQRAHIGIRLEALEGVGQQRRWRLCLYLQLAQHIFLDTAGDTDLFQRLIGKCIDRRAQTPHQFGLVPLDRAIELGMPGTGTVMFHSWLIGCRPVRVPESRLTGLRIFLDLKMPATQCQDVLAVVSMQSSFVGFGVVGQRHFVIVGTQIRVPQTGFAIRQLDLFQLVDKRRHFDRHRRAAR